jgi:hypothetical protein
LNFSIQRAVLTIAMALAFSCTRVSLAADTKPIVFPPLQIFKEFCTDGSWSLVELAQLAQQRHFALVTSEDVPVPEGYSAHLLIWRTESEVGPVVITVVAGENKVHEYALTCSVTAPAEYTDFIESWLRQSLGNPTQTLTKQPSSTELHWENKIDEGKIDVVLRGGVPDEKHSTLAIRKQIAMQNGAKSN